VAFQSSRPYKIDFFNELRRKSRPDRIFERTSEGDRNKEFYYEKAKNFKEIILVVDEVRRLQQLLPELDSFRSKRTSTTSSSSMAGAPSPK
jgi:hypothetical protein